MSQQPYVGVSGYTTSDQVVAVHTGTVGRQQGLRLLDGFCVRADDLSTRWKTNAANHSQRVVSPIGIAELLAVSYSDSLRIVHLAVDSNHDAREQLTAFVEKYGDQFHGFQVNGLRRQAADELASFREEQDKQRRADGKEPLTLILQLHGDLISENATINEVALHVEPYSQCSAITHLLMDTSGGQGKRLQSATAAKVAANFKIRFPEIKLSLAGGLCDGNVSELLRKTWQKNKLVSIDAEGRLRSSDDVLDVAKAISYVMAASDVYASVIHKETP